MHRYLLLIMLMAATLLFANATSLPASSTDAAFRISEKSNSSLTLDFQLPAYQLTQEKLGTNSYSRINAKDCGFTNELGKPELPLFSTRIAIPASGNFSIEALESTQSSIAGFQAYPFQEDNESGAPKAISLDSQFYSTNADYPSENLWYGNPEIIRGIRVVTVQVSPFSYNPYTRQLTVRSSIKLKINYLPGKGENEAKAVPLPISSTFAPLLKSTILNSEDIRGAFVSNTPPRLLIIHGAYADTTFQNTLDKFVLWKKQKGAEVTVTSFVSTASNTLIKSYIQSQYDNINTRPDYIIIIGDTNGSFPIPTWTESYSSYGGEGDYPYTHLDGTDTLGDCFIGRISAETVAQLRIMLARTYLYEKSMNINTASWLNKMLLVGDWSPSGMSTVYINKYIKESSLDVNPDYTFTELYSSEPPYSSMNTALNIGVGIFNYRGWLNMSGWSPSASLVNGYRIPHAVIITCGTGTFENTTSTSEAFLRLGTEATPQGAVTAIGMATTGTHTGYNNTLNGGIFAGLLTQNMRTMGEAMLHGKLYLYQIYGITHNAGANYSAHWCNLIGDPTMEVFIGLPSTYTVSAPASLPVGSSLLDVVVNSAGVAIADQCVTLSLNNTILARAYTDEYGLAVLELPPGLSVGTAVLTVSGHNFLPLQQDIAIVTGGLIPGTIVIDDNNSGSSSGNSDGIANAGERIELSFALQNTTVTAITNLSGTASCLSPYISITNSSINYGTIPAGSAIANAIPLVVQIDAACPDQSNIRLTLRLVDNNSVVYNISEHISVYNGRLSVISQLIVDGGNSTLDPDETAGIRIGLLNSGTSSLAALNAELTSESEFINITNPQVSYGSVAPAAQVHPATDFGVIVNSLCLPGMLIPMNIRVYNSAGFEQDIPITFTVGAVTVTDPLGPDAYGYVIYDMGDNGYADCPGYNWVGIAPAEGGNGSLLTMNDPYTSTEGDQVGADALEVVTLPFTFSFYGRQYNQITVSSNGFIAMGVTENAEFRNFRLPGAMGPSPMIAGFWDDLAIGANSGVYTKYDSAQHRYIVEWYRMLNGYNGTSEETFQIVLYDHLYNNTSTGDGPILIQYKTFNNVDSASSPKHGNFCTIGIQNHDQTIGLEYTYGNVYPTAAAVLANTKSLYITTVPSVQPTPNLTLMDIQHYDSNENGHLEPGESAYLSVEIRNLGDLSASGISATLTTSDPYATILNSTISYPNLQVQGSSVGNGLFQYSIAANCPQDRVINFGLNITAAQGSWQRNFSITVHKPVLLYQNWSYDDFATNLNGIPDPGESGSIAFNLLNESDFDINNAVLTITESSPYIQFTPATISCGNIGGGAVYQAAALLSVIASTPLGASIPVTVLISSDNADPQTVQLNLSIGVIDSSWDFESNNGGFTVVNSVSPGWECGSSTYAGASSGSNVWGTVLNAYHANNATYELISPSLIIGSNTELSFSHRYHAERSGTSTITYWDGGHVLISTNGGTDWSLITPVGGYPVSAVRALGDLPGYSGEVTSWQPASFDLSSFSGQTAKIKWLYKSDRGTAFEGWFIDDVSLSNGGGAVSEIGKISGTISEINLGRNLEGALINIGEYYLQPNQNGSYQALVPPGNYLISAIKAGYRSTNNPITIVSGVHNANVSLSLEYIPCPVSVSWLIEASTLYLRWNPISDSRLSSYKVYKRSGLGNWSLVASPTTTSCSFPLSETGNLRYKITAAYNDGWESLAERTISFDYPFNGTDVQPLPVTDLIVNDNSGAKQISWSPVTLSATDESISVWSYRIFAGDSPDFSCSALNLIGTTLTNTFTDSSSQNVRFYKVKAVIGYSTFHP
ncbi:MAG: C25 family cysteine peptidase [Candidatus Cloacimonetes bacterium]|nr:C25 family cysteine peptidase [Candidatus Cloacimonadota bacterium]